jgi:hypothetical protein
MEGQLISDFKMQGQGQFFFPTKQGQGQFFWQ